MCAIDVDLEGHGLLRLLSEHDDYFINQDIVTDICAKTQDGEPEDKREILLELKRAQREALREQVMDWATSREMFSKALAFAAAHSKKERTLAATKEFLDLIHEQPLRDALKIAPRQKYEMKIKPTCWKADVTRWFSVIVLSYLACGEDDA